MVSKPPAEADFPSLESNTKDSDDVESNNLSSEEKENTPRCVQNTSSWASIVNTDSVPEESVPEEAVLYESDECSLQVPHVGDIVEVEEKGEKEVEVGAENNDEGNVLEQMD